MPRGPRRKSCNLERILQLASNMCTTEEIAADQNVSKDTIERNYAAPIKRGRELAKLSLRARQFQMAMGTPAQYDATGQLLMPAITPNTTMQIWLGKQYLDQKDRNFSDDSDAEGFTFVRTR